MLQLILSYSNGRFQHKVQQFNKNKICFPISTLQRHLDLTNFCELTKKHSTNPSNAIYNLRILLWLQFGELIEVTPEILVTFSKKISRERHLELLRSTNMYRMLYVDILQDNFDRKKKIYSTPVFLVTFSKKISRERHLELFRSTNML